MIRPAFAVSKQPAFTETQDRRMSVFGRLQSWKGPHILCAALEQLGDGAPECDWYGSSSPWPGTVRPAEAYLARNFPAAWNQSFHYRGPVARSAVAGKMAQSRVVIVPSTWDVFNFTVVEAMAAGRPVIVSSGAGASELIEHGVNGFTFPAGDSSALADAIAAAAVLTCPELRAIGTKARATIERELDPARIVSERMAAYQQAIASHRADPPERVPGWLRDLLTPGATGGFDMQDFLSTLPVRPMLAAVADRFSARLRPARRRK